MKVRQYYNNYTLSAKDMGYDDEKRLQHEFDDERIRLRWNMLARQCEVWYMPSRSNPYCAYAIEGTYNICRAISHLLTAQRSKQEQLDQWLAWEKKREDDTQEKIHDISCQIADAAMMDAVGRQSVIVQ